MKNIKQIIANKKYRTVIIIIGILIILSVIGFGNTWYIQSNGIYSIAVVRNIKGTRGGVSADSYYIYNGMKYQTHGVSGILQYSDEGKRFYIQFLASNPKRCKLHTDQPVPDCIGDPPPEGWKEIPKCK